MGLRDDAERAERERVATTAAREAAANAERERASEIHQKLLEFVELCADENVQPITLYRLVHSTKASGRLAWKDTYSPVAKGWVICGQWEDQLAVDERGRTWKVNGEQAVGYFDRSLRRTRGLPRRARTCWVIGEARHLTAKEVKDWALRGATGVLGGRAKDGVISKTAEEMSAEYAVRVANR